MQIVWTNCADKMPPNDMSNVIARWKENNRPELCFGSYINLKITPEFASEYEWAEYTPEKWKYLNNENVK